MVVGRPSLSVTDGVEGTMWEFKTWVIIEKKGKIINNYNRNASPAGQTLKTEQNNTKFGVR